MNIEALQQRLRNFAIARDWQSYHAPKNLAMALMVEAAELMEHFQWATLPESRGLTRDPVKKECVADEIADVLLYLVQLADQTEVNIEAAVEAKLRKNAVKHPPKHVEPPMSAVVVPPSPTPARDRVHLLVDWENVQPCGIDLKKLVPESTDVWLLYGPHQKVDVSGHREVYGKEAVVPVPRSGSGKNALDFQLSYYMGYITANNPQGRFVVVSNDKGYDAMLEHTRMLGFDARRVEYRKTDTAIQEKIPPAEVKVDSALIITKAVKHLANEIHVDVVGPPSSKPAKKVPISPKKADIAPLPLSPNHSVSKTKAHPTTPVPVAQLVQRVLLSLKKMAANRPNSRVALMKMIATHTSKQPDPTMSAQQVLALLEKRQDVQRLPDGKGVRFPRLESPQKKAKQVLAAKKATKAPVKAIKKRAASAH